MISYSARTSAIILSLQREFWGKEILIEHMIGQQMTHLILRWLELSVCRPNGFDTKLMPAAVLTCYLRGQAYLADKNAEVAIVVCIVYRDLLCFIV